MDAPEQMPATDIHALMRDLGARARAAATELAHAPSAAKNAALAGAAEAIMDRRAEIAEANARDMEAARGLYSALGFEEIPPYYFNPLPGSHYLRAELG